MNFFLKTGPDAIAKRLLELKERLVSRLDALGFEILGVRDGAHASSITTFRHAKASSAALFAALEKEHVIASLRHDREGRDYIRFSPHVYNTEAEIDTAMEILKRGI